MISGTKTLAIDPLSPQSCEMRPLWIGHVCPAHPTWSDRDPKSFLYSTNHFTLFWWNRPLPSGNIVAWKGVLALQQWFGRWNISKEHPCGPKYHAFIHFYMVQFSVLIHPVKGGLLHISLFWHLSICAIGVQTRGASHLSSSISMSLMCPWLSCRNTSSSSWNHFWWVLSTTSQGQSSGNHKLALVKLAQIPILSHFFFSSSKTSPSRTDCSIAA